MSPQPRVALDTAVVLRALLLNDAKSKRLRSAWQSGQCHAVIGSATAQALMKSLAFPALKLDQQQQLELLADFLPYAEVVAEQTGAGLGANSKTVLTLAADAAAGASSLDYLVSDCPRLHSAFARKAVRAKLGACSLLGSEEFLASLQG